MQGTYSLIRHSVGGWRTDGGAAKLLCLFILALKDELADTWQSVFGFGIGVVVRRTSPYGFFIQLELFVYRVAKDHGAYTSVAQWQSFYPLCGGSIVP